MSTRSKDRPSQGMIQPDARKTTQQSLLAAVGASGALIAGAVTHLRPAWSVSSPSTSGRSGDGSGAAGGDYLKVVELRQPARAAAAAAADCRALRGGPLATASDIVPVASCPPGDPGGGRDRRRPRSSRRPPEETPVAQAPPVRPTPAPRRGGRGVAAAETSPATRRGAASPSPSDNARPAATPTRTAAATARLPAAPRRRPRATPATAPTGSGSGSRVDPEARGQRGTTAAAARGHRLGLERDGTGQAAEWAPRLEANGSADG